MVDSGISGGFGAQDSNCKVAAHDDWDGYSRDRSAPVVAWNTYSMLEYAL